MTGDTTLRIVYFGHNRKDTAFRRRIRGLLDAGIEVTTFTFRRDGEPQLPGPDWTNVDLGHAEHAKFTSRLLLYIGALKRIVANRKKIATANIVYARNLDICILAVLARLLALGLRRGDQCFVYECLDVHERLTARGLVSATLRWLERRILRCTDLLVVSSPGFIHHYFESLQKYHGEYIWVENKLYFGDATAPRRSQLLPERARGAENQIRCLTIAWIGVIRCHRTLDLLLALAKAKPDSVVVRIGGLVSYFLIPDFDAKIADIKNIVFEGAYDWPAGLESTYQGVDLVWSQDLSRPGKNSDWLIPNRIYEAGYFGVPSICVAGTETARVVRERCLGYVLANASPECLIDFVSGLDFQQLARAKTKLLDRPENDFVAGRSDTEVLIAAMVSTIEETL